MRTASAFLILGAALGLAACNGTDETSVGGSLSGLNANASVTLQNNGGDNLTLAQNGSFHFPTFVPGGSSYNVTVLTQPAGQTCSVVDGSGTLDAAGDPVTTVAVSCVTTASIIGTVSGLAPGTSVTLSNGGETLPIDVNGAFAFPGTVAVGTAYDVTIAVQPAGETCTIANGAGTVTAGVATAIVVTCT
jgi:hypothetical protein